MKRPHDQLADRDPLLGRPDLHRAGEIRSEPQKYRNLFIGHREVLDFAPFFSYIYCIFLVGKLLIQRVGNLKRDLAARIRAFYMPLQGVASSFLMHATATDRGTTMIRSILLTTAAATALLAGPAHATSPTDYVAPVDAGGVARMVVAADQVVAPPRSVRAWGTSGAVVENAGRIVGSGMGVFAENDVSILNTGAITTQTGLLANARSVTFDNRGTINGLVSLLAARGFPAVPGPLTFRNSGRIDGPVSLGGSAIDAVVSGVVNGQVAFALADGHTADFRLMIEDGATVGSLLVAQNLGVSGRVAITLVDTGRVTGGILGGVAPVRTEVIQQVRQGLTVTAPVMGQVTEYRKEGEGTVRISGLGAASSRIVGGTAELTPGAIVAGSLTVAQGATVAVEGQSNVRGAYTLQSGATHRVTLQAPVSGAFDTRNLLLASGQRITLAGILDPMMTEGRTRWVGDERSLIFLGGAIDASGLSFVRQASPNGVLRFDFQVIPGATSTASILSVIRVRYDSLCTGPVASVLDGAAALADLRLTADKTPALCGLFDDLLPDGLVSLSALDTTGGLYDALDDRMMDRRPGWVLWGTPGARSEQLDGNGTRIGAIDHDNRSVSAGLDYGLADGTVVGLAGGHATGDIAFRNGEADLSTLAIGAHAGGGDGGWHWGIRGVYAWTDFETSRAVAGQQLQADFASTGWAVGGSVARDFKLASGLMVTPRADAKVRKSRIDPIRERGGEAAVAIDGMDVVVRSGAVTLGASKAFTTPDGARVTPFAALGYQLSSQERTASMAEFVADPTAGRFSVEGVETGGSGVVLRAGLRAELSDRVTAGLGYGATFGDGRTEHGVRATLSYRF